MKAAEIAASFCECGQPAVEYWRKQFWCRDCLMVEEQPKRSIWGNSSAFIEISSEQSKYIGITKHQRGITPKMRELGITIDRFVPSVNW